MDSTQLQMDFSDATNLLSSALKQGQFSVLIEAASPEAELTRERAIDRLLRLDESVAQVAEINTGLFIPDRREANGCLRGIEYAAELPVESRNRHLVAVSGAGRTPEHLAELLQVASHAGLRNLLPVTGDAPYGATARECRKLGFTDSMIITELATAHPEFQLGAAINPYQYTAYTLLGQYFKLVAKFKRGASFAVTQSGWDMLKLQSLSWYLASRKIFVPILAHLTLLSPDRMEAILKGEVPGVRISSDFRKILEKELCFSRTQFEAAQLRRLELQAVGCRLLGYSGVIVAGTELPSRAVTVARRIAAAMQEFTCFNQWLEAYDSYLASAEMAPFPRHFTLYDRVLHRDYSFEKPPVSNELPPHPLTRPERFKNFLAELIFQHEVCRRSTILRLLKLLLTGCRGGHDCHLERNQYVGVCACPKNLLNGPCGGVRPNGDCELGGGECVYSRLLRTAASRHALPEVEQSWELH